MFVRLKMSTVFVSLEFMMVISLITIVMIRGKPKGKKKGHGKRG